MNWLVRLLLRPTPGQPLIGTDDAPVSPLDEIVARREAAEAQLRDLESQARLNALVRVAQRQRP
jgi:hypothetical protein